jgi:hypothetical protein
MAVCGFGPGKKGGDVLATGLGGRPGGIINRGKSNAFQGLAAGGQKFPKRRPTGGELRKKPLTGQSKKGNNAN